jgi:hypothetical protein
MVDVLKGGLFLGRGGDGGLCFALRYPPKLFKEYFVLLLPESVLFFDFELFGGLLGLAQHARDFLAFQLQCLELLSAQTHNFVDFFGVALQLALTDLFEDCVVGDGAGRQGHRLHL